MTPARNPAFRHTFHHAPYTVNPQSLTVPAIAEANATRSALAKAGAFSIGRTIYAKGI